ncbi:MAG: bifunctional diguanylate cyclase/phosphodiesterase [Paracoccaceae bacterium]
MTVRTGFTGLAGICRGLIRAEALVFLPAATLAAFWTGGERALILTALAAPLVLATARGLTQRRHDPAGGDPLALHPRIAEVMDAVLLDAPATGQSTACLVVQFDEAAELLDRHGRAAQTEVLARCADRICGALRQGDTVARLEGGGFALALAPVRRLDLESALQLAARIQSAITPAISVDGARLYVTCSIGFCLAAQLPQPSGRRLLDAAQIAADEALRNGPGAIRSFSPDMARHRADREAFRDELEVALDEGQIRAWFQPQVSTDTGAITGFEALARWQHPVRGLIPPADFLPAIEDAGLSERLAEVMLFNALSALARWDAAGLQVPAVAVNFSAAELRNPRLAEKIRWELDRFDLAPGRLSAEILETVMADTDNDVIVSNIAGLAAMGCGIDLDDFGTGHSSMLNLRRFSVRRIKIDRSFVTRLDEDKAQQDMVAAILSLAERLGIEALAEGVETPGEHAVLAQLGCQHVQGFGIARPMPPEETADWITRHRARLTAQRVGFRV